MNKNENLTISKYLAALQQQGRYTFEKQEALKKIGCSKAALTLSINRLIKKNHLFMPKRGFLVIVPTEYQLTGVVPSSWYVDDLMAYEQTPYYVCLLSAASLHGASHQQPQEFQVMIPKQLRPILTKNSILHFYTKRRFSSELIMQVKTYTGYMCVSSPALTALDLVQYQHASGYLNNVATVLLELNEKIKTRDLKLALEKVSDFPSIQRLGYLFELVSDQRLALIVEAWIKKRRVKPVSLVSSMPYTKELLNDRWCLYVNEKVEVDI